MIVTKFAGRGKKATVLAVNHYEESELFRKFDVAVGFLIVQVT